MSNPTASLTVNFVTAIEAEDGEVGAASLSVELDPVRNSDKSEFLFGETAWFRVFRYPSTMSIAITPSAGSIVTGGNDSCVKSEVVTFAGENQATTSVAIESLVSTDWYGAGLGSLSVQPPNILELAPAFDPDVNPAACVGVADVDYLARFLSYGLSGITQPSADITRYPVVVFVLGTLL